MTPKRYRKWLIVAELSNGDTVVHAVGATDPIHAAFSVKGWYECQSTDPAKQVRHFKYTSLLSDVKEL